MSIQFDKLSAFNRVLHKMLIWKAVWRIHIPLGLELQAKLKWYNFHGGIYMIKFLLGCKDNYQCFSMWPGLGLLSRCGLGKHITFYMDTAYNSSPTTHTSDNLLEISHNMLWWELFTGFVILCCANHFTNIVIWS